MTAENDPGIPSENGTVLKTVWVGCAIALWVVSLFCLPAGATRWELAASVGDGLHQYVDLDSVRVAPGSRRVASYFTDARDALMQRTDYTTVYDCDRRVFKDLSENGHRVQMDWMSPTDDPLNLGAMNFVCALDGNALLERQS